MLSNSQLRAKARNVLENNIFGNAWLMALVVCLISDLINGVASSIPFASLIIAGPIAVGISGVFLSTVRTGEAPKVEKMFDGFKDFVSNMLLGLLLAIFTFLWSLLFIIPGIIKGYAYSMAYYIKVDHPEYDWKQCIKESQEMMRGHKWRLFCLQFSFIGWILLGLLACGIGLLWVSPYMTAANAEFYEDLKNNRIATYTESEAN